MATTRTLVLVRHAKSAWGLDLDDVERPLSGRGRRDAVAVGRFLAERRLAVDLVYCSPAERARQTWTLAVEGGARAGELRSAPAVYEAFADDLLAVLRGTPDQHRMVMIIGHNPGLSELAALLTGGRGSTAARQRMEAKFPTSGVAVINFDGDWSALRPGSAELESFDVPRGDPKPESGTKKPKARAR